MAAKKPASKPAAKPAKKTAKAAKPVKSVVKKPARPAAAPKKSPTKPTAKSAAKPAAIKPKAKAPGPRTEQKKPEARKTEKPVAKGAAKPTTVKATGKAAAKTTPAIAAKPAPKKKLNVGQKPRTEKAELSLKPQSFAPPPREIDASATSGAKATPASKEAKQTFKVNDHVVYPAHGVGRIVSIEKQMIAGIANELFVLDFEQEKLKLKVPTAKAISSGMRALSDDTLIRKAIDVLKGRARIKRTMWSRRAQEYEAKINSGDVIAVAEVVRDLYRATDQPEQSYSERQLFEAALDRLAREVAAVRKSDLAKALNELDASLQQKKAA